MTTRGLSWEFSKELLGAWRELPVTKNCSVWGELRHFGLTQRLAASSPLQQTKHDVTYLASQRRLQFVLNLVTRRTDRGDITPALYTRDPGFEFRHGKQRL